MDFVLTVDTAVAHLCGLLGVPALVLVPAGGCWRWGVTEETVSHWYGPDLTLYRQPVALEWNATDIVNTLLERIELSCRKERCGRDAGSTVSNGATDAALRIIRV